MIDTARTRNTAIIAAAVAAVGAVSIPVRRFAPSRSGSGDGVLDGAGVRRTYDRIAPIYDLSRRRRR